MTQVVGSLKTRLAIWLLVMVSGLGALLLMEAYGASQRAAERALPDSLSGSVVALDARDGSILPPVPLGAPAAAAAAAAVLPAAE